MTAARWTGRHWLVLLVACLGQFLTQLDLTAVNVALGVIRTGFGTSVSALTWVIDGYLVTFAAFMPGAGSLADLLGRRRVFVAGMSLFALFSACCAAAPSVTWLIAARTAQGAAGAAVLVSSLALLVHGFSGAERTRAIGWWASVAGTALVVGPVAGGLLVDSLGWRSIFWLNVPVGLAGVAGGLAVLAESRGAVREIDWPGQALAVCGLGMLAFGLQAIADAWLGWPLLAAGALTAGAFVLAERRSAAPLVPLSLLRSRAFWGANAAALLLNLATLGLLYLLSLYFEQVADDGAATAGWRIAPLFAAYVLISPWAGRVRQRWGARWPGGVGGAVAAAGALAVAMLFSHPGWIALALALSGVGVGVGLAMPALVSAAITALPPERGGLASGLNNTARQIGNTLGIALLGGIVTAGASLPAGSRDALLADTACYFLAAVLAVAVLPRSRRAAPAPAVADSGTGALARAIRRAAAGARGHSGQPGP